MLKLVLGILLILLLYREYLNEYLSHYDGQLIFLIEIDGIIVILIWQVVMLHM